MSEDLKNLIKNIGIFLGVLVFTGLFSQYIGNLYKKLFHDYGTFISLTSLSGAPLAYVFFLTLLFAAFGGTRKYWILGVLLIPAVVFEAYLDLSHIYFPIALGVLGWPLGLVVRKFLLKCFAWATGKKS